MDKRHTLFYFARTRGGTRKTADEERGEQHRGRQEAAGARLNHSERPAHPRRALGKSQTSARRESKAPNFVDALP